MTRAVRRLSMVLSASVLVCAWFLLGAAPAGADGAGPTNFESVIDSVEPDTDAVRVEIVGGDSFIEVSAEPGTEIEIPGYDGEPYLRIDADGTVLQNSKSPATYLNLTRGGSEGRIPDGLSSRAEPEWETIGRDGSVAWHDHRIHWMLDEAPTTDADGLVQEWVLPLQVDGDDVEVNGRLLRHDDELPWAALVALATAAGAVLVGRRAVLRLAALSIASAAAVTVAVAAYSVNPPRSGASVVPVLLPVVSVVCVTAAWLVRTRRGTGFVLQAGLPLASVAALFGWAVTRIGVFWMPTVPTVLPVWMDRSLTAAVLGTSVGTAVAVVMWPETRPADQDAADDDPADEGPADDGPADQNSADQASSMGRSPSVKSSMPPRS